MEIIDKDRRSFVIYKLTRPRVVLLPDDPMRLILMVMDPSGDTGDAMIMMAIEDRYNCCLPVDDLLSVSKTFGDFVEIIKRSRKGNVL